MLNGNTISAPVSISDVKSCLAENNYNLGKLCTSDKINKWSRYKPINLNQVTRVTEEQYKDNNYGWSIPTYNTRQAVWQAYVNGTGWDYIKPTSYFRLGDFIGYNHDQQSPLIASITNNSPEVDRTVGISCGGLYDVFEWGFMKGYAPHYTGVQIGMLSSNGYYYPFTGPDGLTVLDIDFEKLNIPITSGIFSVGDSYTFCPVLTTWTGDGTSRKWVAIGSDDTSGTWWLLPTNELKVTVITAKTVLDYVSVYTQTVSMTYTDSGTEYTYSNISFTVTLSLSSNYAGTMPTSISAELYAKGIWPGSGTTTQDVLLGVTDWKSPTKGESYSKTINYSGTLKKLTSKEEILSCEARLVSSNGDNRSVHFTLEATEYN